MIVDKKGYLTRSSHRLRSILQKQMTKIRQFSTLDNKQHCHNLIDINNVKEWSIKNVKIARKIMEVPKPPFCLNKYLEWKDDRVANDLLIDYLDWREWDVCNTKNNTDLYTSCNLDNDEKLQMSQTLLSHALTFPLTLGNHMNYFLLQKESMDNKTNIETIKTTTSEERRNHIVRLCCVGPRAEVTLGLDFWREMLIIANLKALHNKCYFYKTNSNNNNGKAIQKWNIHWIIDFIGPDVKHDNINSRSISLHTFDDNDTIAQEAYNNYTNVYHESLTLNNHIGFLHQYILKKYKTQRNDESSNPSHILNYWDGYILFNPGIGHENLMKSWLPTVKFILKTGKPIVTTAHSDLDSQRDIEIWNSILKSEEYDYDVNKLNYQLNPFASRMSYKDPFPPKAYSCNEVYHVNPNYSVMTIM